MGVTSGPKIQDQGLIYCMDPANPRSFSGAGSIAEDVSKKIRGASNRRASKHGSAAFVRGKGRGCFTMDGTDDYLSVPDSEELSGLSYFTICAWVKPTDNRNFWILSKGIGGASGNREFALKLNHSGYAEVIIADESANATINATSRRAISNNQWHYVVATWSGSELKVYVDGGLSGPATPTSLVIEDLSSDLYIGRSFGSSASDFANGFIGTVHIYNTVLSDDDIKNNYINGRGRFPGYERGVTPKGVEDSDKFIFDCLTDSTDNNPVIVLDLYNYHGNGPDHNSGPYEFMIDWGDGTSEKASFPSGDVYNTSYHEGGEPSNFLAHQYQNSGIYTIQIDGQINRFDTSRTQFYAGRRGTHTPIGVRSWGPCKIEGLFEYLNYSSNLTGIPELQAHGPVEFFLPEEPPVIENANHMFRSYSGIYPSDVSNWDFSSADNFEYMFWDAHFDEEPESLIRNMDVSSGTKFFGMFFRSNITSGVMDIEFPSGSDLTMLLSQHKYPDRLDWSALRIPSGCNTDRLFHGVTDSGILDIDTSNVEIFNYWLADIDVDVTNYWDFSNATSIKQLTYYNVDYPHDISNFNFTPNKLKDISYVMYYNTTYNHSLDFLVSSGVEIMDEFFYGCTNIPVDVGSWDTSTVKSMRGVFNRMGSNYTLVSGSLANLIGSSVEDVRDLFYACSIPNFNQDFSNWDMSSVKNALRMFASSSTNILDSNNQSTISGWDVGAMVTGYQMFQNLSDFNVDLSSWNLSSAEDLGYMFSRCTSLNQDFSSWNVSGVKIDGLFYGCTSMSVNNLHSLDVSLASSRDKWLPSNYNALPPTGWFKGNMRGFFSGTSFNQNISSYDFSQVTNMRDTFRNSDFNQDVSSWDVSNVTDMTCLFLNCPFNQSLANWDVSNVTTIENMFYNSSFTQWSSIANWDTSSLTSLYYAFRGGNEITGLDLGNWDTSGVTNMMSAFRGNSWNDHPRFANGGAWLSNWDTSNVTNMSAMFYNNWYNTNLGVTGWDVSKVTDFSAMFQNNTWNLDLSNWDVSSATRTAGMFKWSYNFNRDITSWDLSKVGDMREMFFGARQFNQDISQWDFSGKLSGYYSTQRFRNFFSRASGWSANAFSKANYDKLLIKWQAHAASGQIPNNQQNVDVDSYYSSAAASARTSLINDYGWTITDRGQQ